MNNIIIPIPTNKVIIDIIETPKTSKSEIANINPTTLPTVPKIKLPSQVPSAVSKPSWNPS